MTWRAWFRTDTRIAVTVLAATFLLLILMSFNGERAARDGFLAGIGWRYLQGVLLTMCVWGLFSTGLGIQFGRTGLLNFGHVLFLGAGAYTAAVLTWRFGPQWHAAGPGTALLAVLFILVVSAVLAVLFALILGLPTLRLREDYLAIVTIGAAEIMRLVWNNELWLTNGPKGLSVRMPGAETFTAADGAWRRGVEAFGRTGIELDPYFTFLLLIVGLVLGGTLWLTHHLVHSPWGRVLTAIRENEDVAAALGKNVFAFKLQSLVVGGIIAAVAGIFWAWSVRFVTPTAFLPLFTFYAWIMVVIGGADRPWGPFVGSVVLWGLFEAARQASFLRAIADTSGPAQVALIGLLLVLIMRFRPQGILGSREVMRIGR